MPTREDSSGVATRKGASASVKLVAIAGSITPDRRLHDERAVYAWPPSDEIELLGLTRAVASVGGVHLLAYGDPTALAATALLLRALRRSNTPIAAVGVWNRGC